MTGATDQPDSDDAADDELAAARAGQSTTVEEAMHDATKEDGFPHESAYTPSTPDPDPDPGA